MSDRSAWLEHWCPTCHAASGARCRRSRWTSGRGDAAAQLHVARGWLERSCPTCKAPPGEHCSTRPGTDGWLIPGRHAGQHVSADTLQKRLKRYGIERSREGRHAALLALAARLPAPILAERIGIHQSRAAAWVRMAGGTYADYVALRSMAEASPVG